MRAHMHTHMGCGEPGVEEEGEGEGGKQGEGERKPVS